VAKKLIYVSQPFNDASIWVFEAIMKAGLNANCDVVRVDDTAPELTIRQAVIRSMKQASIIVADVSESAANVMHDIGFAQAQSKPIILIANSSRSIPFDLAGMRVLIYDIDSTLEFMARLEESIKRALDHPEAFLIGELSEEREPLTKVFISYSHHDREYLDRLLIHLKPLEREGLIDLWVDSRLRAGDRWKTEIAKALDLSTVAILVVSADFLASDFIINNELQPILRNAAEKGTRIVPLIVKPCRFARDKELRHFQAINDPSEALILLTEGERELHYDAVASEVEKALRKS